MIQHYLFTVIIWNSINYELCYLIFYYFFLIPLYRRCDWYDPACPDIIHATASLISCFVIRLYIKLLKININNHRYFLRCYSNRITVFRMLLSWWDKPCNISEYRFDRYLWLKTKAVCVMWSLVQQNWQIAMNYSKIVNIEFTYLHHNVFIIFSWNIYFKGAVLTWIYLFFKCYII